MKVFFSNMAVGEYNRIESWLKEMKIEKYTINKDLTVDVDDDVSLDNKEFKKLPIQFGKVKGLFDLDNCKNLETLKGCPKEVSGWFSCESTRIISLEGGPKKVGGNFWCRYCKGKFNEQDVRQICKVGGEIVT